MNDFDKLLKAIASGLKAFADGIEAMSVEMGKKEEMTETEEAKSKPSSKSRTKPAESAVKEPDPQAPKKPSRRKRPVSKQPASANATEWVLDLIEKSGDGIDLEMLCERTGFNKRKIHGIVHRLKKQGKIKSDRKGFYVIL